MRLKRIITFVVLVCALAVCGRTARAEDDENAIAAETYVIRGGTRPLGLLSVAVLQ